MRSSGPRGRRTGPDPLCYARGPEDGMGTIGSISFEWAGPRFVRSRSKGELQHDETGALMEVIGEKVRGEPYFLWEVDVTELTGMTAEARRTCADHLRRLPDRAIAVVGGKFAQKILVKLVLTAVAMLDPSQRNNQVSFFSDSESAQRWLRQYAENYKPLDLK